MKSKSNRSYFLIVIFLLLFVEMAIHEHQDIIDIEHFFSTPAFECIHPEDLALANGDKFQELVSFIANASAYLIFQKENFSIQLPHQLFSSIPPDEQASVLRC
jgi:hypothetical protein